MSHHHHHHHHQPLHLNFSGVKTAFIAAGRDRRRGGRGRAAGGHVFSSNISLAITNHAHAHASILARSVGARSSLYFEEKAGFNGSQWGNSSKLKALSPLYSLCNLNPRSLCVSPHERGGTSDPESFRGGPCDVQAKKS